MNDFAETGLLKNFSIRTKLALLAGIGATMLALTAGYLLWQQYQNSYESRKVAIRQNVEVAASVVDWAYQQEASGQISREQAQAIAVKAINDARYSGKEYFWINDMDVKLITHPFRPDLNGKDVSSIKDPDGNAVFVAFVDTVKKDGSGYLSYLWPKPGQDKPVEKVSFVTGFKPWGWVIGSGLYMDDLRTAFILSLEKTAAVLLAAIALTAGVAFAISRSIIRPLQRAVLVAKSVALGKLDNNTATTASDETGQLLQAMGAMQSTLTAFNAAQQEMARRHNDLGQTSHVLPEGDFSGAFKDMAMNFNAVVHAQSNMNSRLVELIGMYVKGQFDERMQALPGEKKKGSSGESVGRF